MKSKTEKHTDPIDYGNAQTPKHAAICQSLRIEIDAALPKAASKIWHGSPVWFIGENPVAGYSSSSKGVTLMFWSGQLFDDPGLQPIGKDKAARILYVDVAAIDREMLRSWLKKAGTTIWDYAGEFARKRATAGRPQSRH